jgi:predicted Zn-dependent protease
MSTARRTIDARIKVAPETAANYRMTAKDYSEMGAIARAAGDEQEAIRFEGLAQAVEQLALAVEGAYLTILKQVG